MDFVFDFLYVGDGDAIVIWARDPGIADYVFFIDGGNSGCGQKVIDHFEKWIRPHLQYKRALGFINSHPHEDHIDGLLEIIEKLGAEIRFGIYNDPVECITTEHKDRLYKAYMNGEDPDITHLYKEFEQVEKLNKFCLKHNVQKYNGYSETVNFWDGKFRILSPSKDFYVNMVQYFSDETLLKTKDFSKEPDIIMTVEDDVKPCDIVDEYDDASPENLTSTVIQLTDSKGYKYILTADAGVESFNYIETENFDPSNTVFVQLPHHGSRRNVNSKWLKKFNPNFYIVSAEGNAKHPRKVVINCIKRNLENCAVYSTHLGKGTISYTTNQSLFPTRNWGSATPL